jgi:hypothetical protein
MKCWTTIKNDSHNETKWKKHIYAKILTDKANSPHNLKDQKIYLCQNSGLFSDERIMSNILCVCVILNSRSKVIVLPQLSNR